METLVYSKAWEGVLEPPLLCNNYFMDEKKFYLQIFTNEDVSKDPPWAHGQVKAHEPGDALGLACLGHLDTHLVS